MVLDIILPILAQLIADPIKHYVVAPIKRHASYAFKCDSKLQGLQQQADQLKSKGLRLQRSVDDATRNGEEIYPDVSEWLTAADKDIREAEELIQRTDDAKKNKCFFGLCPNLKTRHQLSKSTGKKTLAIGDLCKVEFAQVSFQPQLQQIVEPSLYSREALPSRVSVLNQVMDALTDPNLNTIGVVGMGGVGKTTLAKEVLGRALQDKLFDTAVMVPVSQAPEIRRIQGQIADFLGMKYSAEEIQGRASQLHRRLENSKVLIILDDLWHKLDLNAVGIPSQGCKIMLTSRSMDLLSTEMQVLKLFPLEALQEEETLCLFQMSVAEAKDPQFHHIANEIARKCGGLPLLVDMVAKDLRNKESYRWNNMLNRLSVIGDGEIYQKVHRVLESSYENLPGEEMKQFFLLCALFEQSNIQIKSLLTHSMGLGLFKHIFTVEEARDSVFTMIDKLKAKSLLLDGDMAGYVKMHDVVRDTALSIASRVQHAFIGSREAGFRDWPSRDCSRISLPYCNVNELPLQLDCPEVEAFLLFTEDLSLKIPDLFFEGMEKLKVTDLRGMRLVPFPSSLGMLTTLQTLSLHKCKLDNMTVLGELRQLEFLSFAYSNIVELPRETESLTRLKLLDLQGCSDLLVIHESLFSKLCSLEELYMLNSFERWNVKGNVRLEELENLDRLSTLEIHIPIPKMIPIGFKCFTQLKRYKISIGSSWYWNREPEGSRVLKLEVEEGVHLEHGTEFLLRDAEYLFLDGEKGIDNLFYEGFPKLKHMHVTNDSEFEHLIKSTMPASCSVFPVLESLYLKNFLRLEMICRGQLGMGSFGELRVLKISNCNNLSSLFSFSSIKCLEKLQELEVQWCENMEAVVDERNEDEGIELSQLSSLKLSYLPHLTGFCKIKEGTEQMGMLFNSEMVRLPLLTSLRVANCDSLKNIFTASMVKCLMQLKKLEISSCGLVKEMIQSKKMEEIEGDSREAIMFPKLDHLSLGGLNNMKWFSSGYSIKFISLRELSIGICFHMRNFVGRDSSSESAEDYLFNEMVTFSNLETLEIFTMPSIKRLWDEQHIADDSFSKLKSISISDCSKLAVVFPSEICTRFRSLETLSLSRCCGVEEIYQKMDLKEVNNPFSLRKLRISELRSLKHIWNKESAWNKGSFPAFQNLQSVAVEGCKNLKYVFPASVGCGLPRLQCLQLTKCKRLEVMIAKARDDEGAINASFQFPQLKMLKLEDLREMRSLHEGGFHTLECPNLKNLTVLHCSNISLEKFIANVEELIVDEQGSNAIFGCADVSGGFCSKLKEVTLRSVNEETSTANIFSFLSELKCVLEMLVLDSCSLEAIFRLHHPLDRRPIGDEQHHCLRVKHLKLQDIEKLNYVIKEDSQFNQLLQTLNLKCCVDLMGIAPSSTCLRNLTALHVFKCDKMKNVITASTAKTMEHLFEMTVERCKSIEEIVANDGDGTNHDVLLIFKKLQRLTLTELPNLTRFCSNKYSFSFLLLELVYMSECPGMKIFGGGVIFTEKLQGIVFEDGQQWEGLLNATISSQLGSGVREHLEDGKHFKTLQSLEMVNSPISKAVMVANQMRFSNKLRRITVRDCDSIQVVFDLEGLSAVQVYTEQLLPKLQHLNLANLPLLTQLCNKDPKGILEFNKLLELKINNCSRLEYALTWSMASCLTQLRSLGVENCEMMETFIVDEENVADKVTFIELQNVVLENMPKFSSIYSGSGHLESPSLKEITVRKCPNIKALLISRQVHSTNQAFPKLEKMLIDMKFVEGMMQYQAPTELFSELKILDLRHCSAKATSHVLLVRFLSRLLNLDQLELHFSFFQELLNSELDEALTMPHIKSLRLTRLFDLNKIWWRASLFHSLETLDVFVCNQLTNLMTPSTAKSMEQLKLLRIDSCKMLMEIVGDGCDQKTEEITFTKLKTVELVNLRSLKAFSLTHYNFSFPCLDKISLNKCPNLRIFCNGTIKTEVLDHVHEGCYSNNYWDGNLNSTTQHMYHQMVGFQYFYEIKLSALPMLKENWEAQFPTGILSSLERLEVDNCELFSNALPSRLVKHLGRLKVLIVEKCDSVERVIDLEGLNASESGTKQMKKLEELHLIDLPQLKQVWTKDPQKILSFKNLRTLKVDNCCSLTCIFNLSMASSLRNLKLVEVKNCSLVEHIIVISEEETVQQYQTILPSLRSLTLLHLPNLFRFCSASGVLEIPSLITIEVADCLNVQLFPSTFSEGQHLSITSEEKGEAVNGVRKCSNPFSFSALLGNKIVIPGLEELTVEWKALKNQLFGDYRPGFLSKLKCIGLTGLQGEEDANFLPNLLRPLLSLEKLCLSNSSIEEILFDNLSILKDKNLEPLVSLTKLKLSNLPKLKHLVRDECQPIPLFENLVDLEVTECSSLKILVPLSVSFHNLTDLRVSKCDGLTTLLSASTARSLVQLRRMDVKNCKMMQEIVAVTADGEEYEIRFSQLEYLGFDDLPGLKNFSSGNHDFHFPSLEEVMVIECPNMKNFAEKVSVTTKLREVKTGLKNYEWEWEGSLNNTIQALYMQKDVEEAAAIRSGS